MAGEITKMEEITDSETLLRFFDYGEVPRFVEEPTEAPDIWVFRFLTLLFKANIPKRYRKAYLHSIRAEEGKEKAHLLAHKFVDEARKDGINSPTEKPAILLVGGFGTGKTHYASAVMKSLMAEAVVQGVKFDAKFLKYYEFVRSIQAGYGSGTADSIMNGYRNVDLLVLDDFGDGNSESEDRMRLAYELLDHRCDALKRTIITSNLDSEVMKDVYGERTTERIHAMCRVSKIAGRNYRL